MNKQKIISVLNRSFTDLWLNICLFVLVFGLIIGTTQSVFAQSQREAKIKVNEITIIKAEGEIAGEVSIQIGNSTIVRARFDKDKKEFRTQGLKEGRTTVTFTGTYRQNGSNNNGGMTGGVQQNGVPFRYVLNVTVEKKSENTENNAPIIPSERGKNIQIFYTNLRAYDAQKADQILRERGYIPNKKLMEDGESTQSQRRKLYCVLNSGGTEAGVRAIAELVRNIETVETKCLADRPNNEPQYSLWIVSEQPLLAELEDYKKEVEEAENIFIRRFGSPPGNNYILRTYKEEFEKEGEGDWKNSAGIWSDRFWLRYIQPNSRTATAAIYVRPLAILNSSIYNIKEKKYLPTSQEIGYFRSRMTDWRTRKDALTPRLNEIIQTHVQDNSDSYANVRLQTLSKESLKARENERRERRKIIDAEINQIMSNPVFAYTLGGARN